MTERTIICGNGRESTADDFVDKESFLLKWAAVEPFLVERYGVEPDSERLRDLLDRAKSRRLQ